MPDARRLLAGAVLLLLAVAPLPALSSSTEPSLVPAGYVELIGPMHEHSGYSDGYPGSTPSDYYASAKAAGNDFLMSGEHSDSLGVPLVLSERCLGPAVTGCALADPDPVKALTKWPSMQAAADDATDEGFTGVRGFEWTSDRFNHINVYFSRHLTNAKADGGYGAMATFYEWLTTRPELGGGGDGLATFNHPGAKELQVVGGSDPARDWDSFAYVPEADRQMVGLEVFNDDDHFGDRFDDALDKGWHVGAVGAEDLGHRPSDDWGGPRWAKTVLLAKDRSPAALREAMQARRFYAVRTPDVRLGLTVDGAVMGSRIPGRAAHVVRATAGEGQALELVTTGGRVVATGTGTLSTTVARQPGDRYYFLRVKDGGREVGYSSPVWFEGGTAAAVGEWLAGDLHVHTCYSHDSYCGPEDDNTGPEEAYTAGGSPTERFAEAAAKGLDYLALTDHHSDSNPEESGFDSVQDPGFGSSGVIGVAGYENSIGGHAQMLGARRVYPRGDGSDTAIDAMADALRADGGLFQANHPADDLGAPVSDCSALPSMHWQYGLRVPVDSVEVWNIGHHLQPPFPSGTSNGDALAYWECWLSTGAHVAPTGGSDSHWLSTAAVQGVGNPTTWVFAQERSQRGVLDAIRAGRTSISFRPPVAGGAPLLLEADTDGDGSYDAVVGDTVAPGVPLRVRSLDPAAAGLVDVRGNGRTLVAGAQLTPGGVVDLVLDEPGWVWAQLYADEPADDTRSGTGPRASACEPLVGAETTYCRNRVGVLAMTGALYLAEEVDPTPTATATPTTDPTPTATPTPTCTPRPRPSGHPQGDKDKCKP